MLPLTSVQQPISFIVNTEITNVFYRLVFFDVGETFAFFSPTWSVYRLLSKLCARIRCIWVTVSWWVKICVVIFMNRGVIFRSWMNACISILVEMVEKKRPRDQVSPSIDVVRRSKMLNFRVEINVREWKEQKNSSKIVRKFKEKSTKMINNYLKMKKFAKMKYYSKMFKN